MNPAKQKPRLSVTVVVIIFLISYLSELAIGGYFGYFIFYPKFKQHYQQNVVKNYYSSKVNDPNLSEISSILVNVSPHIIENLEMIDTFITEKKFDLAINKLNRLNNLTKNDYDKMYIQFSLNEIYYRQDDYEKVNATADNMISLFPNLSIGYRYKAEYYLERDEYDKALEFAQKAVQIKSNANNHYLLSISLTWKQKFTEALEEIKTAAKLDPKNENIKKELERQQKEVDIIKNNSEKPSSNTPITTKPNEDNDPYNYSQSDTDSWKAEVDFINQDLANITPLYDLPNYDKAKLKTLNDLLINMKSIAERIYNKMSKKQPITIQDDQDILKYNKYSEEQQKLKKELFN